MIATSSNTAIIVDSACDLPEDLLKQYGIFVLPIEFEVKGKQYRDRRIPEMASAFNEKVDLNPAEETRTEPTSPETIRDFIVEHIVDHFEFVVILCISSTRSQIYGNAAEALKSLPHLFPEDSPSPGKLQHAIAIDTRAVFSGEALLARFTSNILQHSSQHAGITFPELISLIKNQIRQIHTYVVPDDLRYLKNRGRLRNEKSVGQLDYLIATTLGLRPVIHWERATSKKIKVCKSFASAFTEICRIARGAIDQGLGTNSITVSFSGDIDRIGHSKSFIALSEYAESHGVRVILAQMSITASIYMGPNAVSLSFSVADPELEVESAAVAS